MIERVPPTVVVFVGGSWVTQRPKVLARLPRSLVARVPFVRYDPQRDFEAAFIEETRQRIDQAAGYLLPDLAPALPILLVADPAAPDGPPPMATLLCRACPPQLAISTQWLGIYRPETFPAWDAAARTAGATFLLSPVSRRGLLQGVGLDNSFQSLILTFIATETSRYPERSDSFTSIRFGKRGRVFLTSVDHDLLPDFETESAERVETAVAAHYLPEITEVARHAAAAHAPVRPEALLTHPGPRAVFEADIAEPLLCAAIARSVSLDQSLAHLSNWAESANRAVAELLDDLQVGLRQWMLACNSRHPLAAPTSLAEPLFNASGFPALHRLSLPFVREHPGASWKKLIETTRNSLIEETRTALDDRYYEYLPHDLSHAEKSLRVARSMGEPAAGGSVAVTRHLPSYLVHDMRREILRISQMSIVLYSMERSQT